ncbi:MAG: hypothetical protein PHS65_06890 [Arcobacteraceae bacterium]|nr:hypothetical protein [Arcobacteraceae bacterium]
MEEWDNAIREAVNETGESFDSHDIIKKVAHRNQRNYVSALAEINSDTPFHQFHSALGRRIKIVCEELGYVSQDSRSLDMFGQNSKCQQWSQ